MSLTTSAAVSDDKGAMAYGYISFSMKLDLLPDNGACRAITWTTAAISSQKLTDQNNIFSE